MEQKKVPDWINHFVSLITTYPESKNDYSKYIAVLKQASFCESSYVQIEHDTTGDSKLAKLTLTFDNLNNLTKFVETIEESVRFT